MLNLFESQNYTFHPSAGLRMNGFLTAPSTRSFLLDLMALLLKGGKGFILSDAIKTAILLPLLLGLMALTGCMVGPDYKESKMQMSEKFANESGKGLSSGDVETSWWRGFNDEKLNHLVELAIGGNYDLRIATANIREARALRLETQFDLYPTVTFQASYTRERLSKAVLSVPGSDRNIDLYNAGFDASWELDFFGRVRRSIEAATAEVEASEAVRHDVMVSLLAEVARNYFELRGAQNQLEVARRNAENQKQTLDLTIALLEGGRGTELDTSRQRAQLNLTLATIPPLETAIKRAIYRLSVLTGQQPTALEQDLSQPLPLPDLPKLVALGTPEGLLRRRPDIRVAERNLAAATARIGVATADLFPRITFTGSIALQAGSFSGIGKGSSGTFFLMPQIFWAAFDLGRVRARIKAAGARTEAALAQYEQTIMLALEETEDTLVDFDRQQQRLEYLRTSAQASEKAVKLAQLRYQYGVADFLTVLDAERTLLQAQDQLAQSETSTATALIAVNKSLGGGWEIENENRYENKSSDKTK
jgi:outer membrane protein, multidrug efflux system